MPDDPKPALLCPVHSATLNARDYACSCPAPPRDEAKCVAPSRPGATSVCNRIESDHDPLYAGGSHHFQPPAAQPEEVGTRMVVCCDKCDGSANYHECACHHTAPPRDEVRCVAVYLATRQVCGKTEEEHDLNAPKMITHPFQPPAAAPEARTEAIKAQILHSADHPKSDKILFDKQGTPLEPTKRGPGRPPKPSAQPEQAREEIICCRYHVPPDGDPTLWMQTRNMEREKDAGWEYAVFVRQP